MVWFCLIRVIADRSLLGVISPPNYRQERYS